MSMKRSKADDRILYDLEDHVQTNQPEFTLVGDGDIEKISSILGQSHNSNLMYVGKTGLGKTANIYGIAQRKKATIEGVSTPDQPRLALHMIDRRYLLLDTNKLFSENDPERIQQNLRGIFAELDKPGKHVLVIEDMNDWLKGIEDNQCQGMISTFVRELKRGTFQLIAMVRDEPGRNNLGKVLECHSEMAELFTILEKKPPTQDEVLEVMRKSKKGLEDHHDGLHITDEANEEVVKLTFQYPNLRHYMRQQPARSLRMRDQIASTFVTRMQAQPAELAGLETEVAAIDKKLLGDPENMDLLSARDTLNVQIQAVQDAWDERTQNLGKAYLKKRSIEQQLQGYERELDNARTAFAEKFKADNGRDPTDTDYANQKTSAIKELEQFIRIGRTDLAAADEAAQKIKGEHNTQLTLNVKDIREGFSEMTGIPVKDLNADEATKVMDLDKRLKDKVYGQDDVIDTVADAIKRSKAGLKDPSKPIGSFMMLGSSGVGKTYLAECLAGDLYDDPEALTVFDMSEYMERQNLSRLIGSTPGLVGYGEGGKLTNAVRARPYQIVLFDEIEKAHPDVFKILLQVLDKGRLSDELGTVDFRNTVILMTTNLGQTLSFDKNRTSANSREDIISTVRKIFPQELINRVDDYMLFKAHEPSNVERIVAREIKALNKQLSGRGIDVTLPTEDIGKLVADKYLPEEGARQILKFLGNKMTSKIADIVLTHSQNQGGGSIAARYTPESEESFSLSFNPKQKEPEVAPVTAPSMPEKPGTVTVSAGAHAMRTAASVAFAPMFH